MVKVELLNPDYILVSPMPIFLGQSPNYKTKRLNLMNLETILGVGCGDEILECI